MRRLLHVISFTADLEQSRQFYCDGLGLEPVADTPYLVDFSDGEGGLVLLAVHPVQKREVELCFEAPRVEDAVQTLREHGVQFADEVRRLAFGTVVHFRDPEGNLLSLLQPTQGHQDPGGRAGGAGAPADRAPAATGSPQLATAIVSAGDVAAVRAFYRDRLGLRATLDSPWWVQFDTGHVTLAVHPRPRRPTPQPRSGQPVSFGFIVPDLMAWAEATRARGVTFLSAPNDEGFGLQAEALDPEGNLLVFREPLAVAPLEEQLAEEFEDDDAPRHTGMRRPVRKGTHAVSRVVIRPEYKATKKTGTGKRTALPKRSRPASAAASSASAGSRLKTASRSDAKRARTRAASGRQKKAVTRTLTSQKRAIAKASRAKPVKRAAARSARRTGR